MPVAFLGDEWIERTLALSAGQPEQPGASVRVQYVVTGGPQEDKPQKDKQKDKTELRYYWVVEDGRVVACGPGPREDAELTWTATYRDAGQILTGELDAGAAFMRGTVKVAGDLGKVLTLLRLLATDPYRRLASELAAQTVFS